MEDGNKKNPIKMNIEVIIVIAIVAGMLGRAAFRAWRERC
jgi:hypothetical protein